MVSPETDPSGSYILLPARHLYQSDQETSASGLTQSCSTFAYSQANQPFDSADQPAYEVSIEDPETFNQVLSPIENVLHEGAPREEDAIQHGDSFSSETKPLNKKKYIKQRRNSGEDYQSEKSGKYVSKRKAMKPPCSSDQCRKKNFSCGTDLFTEELRLQILDSFWKLGTLTSQRQFIVQHVSSPCKGEGSKSPLKKQNLVYQLTVGCEKRRVCKVFFLSTLGISERQIYTALKKVDDNGILQPDGRGGRQQLQVTEDERTRQNMKEHINKFPRIESHYARARDQKEYLCPSLSIERMFEMFKNENEENTGSLSTYRRVFRQMKLSFHRQKKDLCGLCETYRKGDDSTKVQLENKYRDHMAEKEEVRQLKEKCKTEAITSLGKKCALCFDLQQVIFLPQSNRGEIFYKRRLSNYNFTTYNLGTKEGTCFMWHECLAKRGANEISSCLYIFLKEQDAKGAETIDMFCDGCAGQNKNSIVPAMIIQFLKSSSSTQTVNLHIMVPNHGQSEGDSMHACIERRLKATPGIMHPAELQTIAKLARKEPYRVISINTDDILNFKDVSANMRILSQRTSDSGETVDWRKMAQMSIRKNELEKIFFKTSHKQKTYDSISIPKKRTPFENAKNLYDSPPKMSLSKWEDLKSLCVGETPVVTSGDVQNFYLNLPH